MKLHLGCGKKVWADYVNVDLNPSDPTVINSDLRVLPFDDGVATEIVAIHVVEHFDYWDLLPMLREWCRVAAPGCRLILEMPCAAKCAENIVKRVPLWDGQMGLWGFYGDPGYRDPLMMHRWAWTAQTLAPMVTEAGWAKPKPLPAQFHKRERRDFRLEAVKP